MTGALRYDAQAERYYNSLLTIDRNGAIDRIYDKSHLVPFGEYIPFQKWIPLPTITQFQGFEKGGGPPDFIVNVTNDAWYGDSAGPRQHLVKAQFRAIEEGVPVLRAANTGISAIIGAHGRKLALSKTFTQEVVLTKLPVKKVRNN